MEYNFSDAEQVIFNLKDANGNERRFVGKVRNYEVQKECAQLRDEIKDKIDTLEKNEEEKNKNKKLSKDDLENIEDEIRLLKHKIMGIIFGSDVDAFKVYSIDLIDAVIEAYGEYNSKKFRTEKTEQSK